MTRDEITQMAREAGFVGFDGDNGSLRRFAALVAAAEREECAKLADVGGDGEDQFCCVPVAKSIAAAIRARGQS